MSLRILEIGPAASVQDAGRPGFQAQGVSRAGAADVLALHEGAALLRQRPDLAALEMAGTGGLFEVMSDLVIAMTGAPMEASADGDRLAWNASHALKRGQRLRIGAARRGTYGYLHLAGGIDADPLLGSRATHLTAGLGRAMAGGDVLKAGAGAGGAGLTLDVADRFDGGTLRVVESFQSALFDAETRARFAATGFRRGAQASRMGVKLDGDGSGFAARGQLNVLSEIITPGDIQMTGAGEPYVLLFECQTTGGYPRIGTVIPCDLPRAAQAPAGAPIRFEFISLEQADRLHAGFAAELARMPGRVRPRIRDPHDIADLLSYQLIGGAVSATDPGE